MLTPKSAHDAKQELQLITPSTPISNVLTWLGMAYTRGLVSHHEYHDQLANAMTNGILAKYLEILQINEPRSALQYIYESLANTQTQHAINISEVYERMGFNPALLTRTNPRPYLELQNLFACINEGTLTLAQVLALTTLATFTLENAGVRELIRQRTLSLEQALALTPAASWALRNAGVRELIHQETLSLAQVLASTDAASLALRNTDIHELMHAGTLDLAQVLALTDAASRALINTGIHELMHAGTLTLEQVLALTDFTDAAYSALENAGVRELITAGAITFAQVLALTDNASGALTDADTQRLLRNGQLTMAHILNT